MMKSSKILCGVMVAQNLWTRYRRIVIFKALTLFPQFFAKSDILNHYKFFAKSDLSRNKLIYDY